MDRLRKLREDGNYSQQQLATMLKTTQQTIARWESGKSEPNLAALRDLALIFGASVDDLLGVNPGHRKMPTTTYHLFTKEEQDGFWGHVGLRVGEKPSMWFPITAGTASELRSALANVENTQSWVSFETLANKFVAFRPAALRKVWLLDDACDQPAGDWEVDLPYEGLPLEMYRAFDRLHDIPVSEQAWKEAYADLPKRDGLGEPQKGDPEKWRAFVNELAKDFNGEVSEAFISSVAATYAEEHLYEEDRYYPYMHYTKVYFTDGASDAFWAEANDLSSFAFELDREMVPTMLRLEHFDGSAEPYYSTDKLAAVVMPLTELMDAQKEEAAED
ncbi:MAG: hypothetical protein CGW95_15595 [Phenylobacterium zucineum]|nr:MAG: hypothetical protein CGW95_15595 [Phenylobacterium zucineum]